jgi:hypothetical protein
MAWLHKKRLASLRSLDFAGSRGGIRTPDRVVNSHLLCRLSYPGILNGNHYLYIQRKLCFISKIMLLCQITCVSKAIARNQVF